MPPSGPSKRPFSSLTRSQTTFDTHPYPTRKPLKRARTDPKSAADTKYFDDAPGLDDIGIVRSLGGHGSGTTLQHALDTGTFVRENLFDAVPDRAAGLGGSRMADTLNFQRNCPPLVSTAHVHALSASPSAAEREIAAAIKAGKLRRVHVPFRGSGVSSVSDLLVSMTDLRRFLVRSRVRDETREAYLAWLAANPFAIVLPAGELMPDQLVELVRAGFLTSSSGSSAGATATVGLSTAAEVGTATSISTIASAAAGSAQAIGGHGATFGAGGGGAGVLQRGLQSGMQYQVAVPNTGPYLKLITAARTHIVDLLKKSNRQELPLYLLKEYWEAGLSSKKTMAEASKKPFEKLLPGQTKKWKAFYGMKFEFALEEAFGAGLVECFNTRAVGLGVRVT